MSRRVLLVSHAVRTDLQHLSVFLAARLQARAEKNWGESDRIRDVLNAENIILEDGAGGTTWRRG